MPAASKKIDLRDTRKCKHPDFNDKNDEQWRPEQTKSQREHLHKAVIRRNNVTVDDVHLREYAVEQKFWQGRKMDERISFYDDTDIHLK